MAFVRLDASLNLLGSIKNKKNQSIFNFVVECKFKVCSLTPTKKERKHESFEMSLRQTRKAKIQSEINIHRLRKRENK
jgi:hypothetical protein